MKEIRRLEKEVDELREKVQLLSEQKDEWKCKAEALEREKATIQVEVDNLTVELRAYRKGWNSN